MADFNQIFGQNCEQRVEQKYLKTLQFGQKRGICEVQVKEGAVT
jgi:hypothetical protein